MEFFNCFLITVQNRHITQICTCHDESIKFFSKEQIMKRGVGKHNTEVPVFTEMPQFRLSFALFSKQYNRPAVSR